MSEGERDEKEPGEVLTVEEAARLLRIGRTTLYDALGRCEVPHQKIGRTIRLSRTAVLAWLASKQTETRRRVS